MVSIFGHCVEDKNNSNMSNKKERLEDLHSTSRYQNIIKSKALEQYTPVSFLNSLQTRDGYYKTGNFPKNWIQKSDIDTLITLIDSKKNAVAM